jgi:hypothetical protein
MAHGSASFVLQTLAELRLVSELIATELKIDSRIAPTPAREEWTEKRARSIASQVVKVRKAAEEGDRIIGDVTEEFGAVTAGIVKFRGRVAHSFHRVAIEVAFSEVLRTAEAVDFAAEEENRDA